MISLILLQTTHVICEHVKHSNAIETYAVTSKLVSQSYFPEITTVNSLHLLPDFFLPTNNMKGKLTLSLAFSVTKHIVAICTLR